jgi:CheY-like chemotaxis protein
MMDGDIGVESVVGVGSTFWFTVLLERQPDAGNLGASNPDAGYPEAGNPLVTPAIQSATHWQLDPDSPPAAFVSPAGREFRAALAGAGRSEVSILLVEDNPANMRVTQALLETLGCHVSAARNGLEAVGMCRHNRFDLVLMDCQMPEMDGYEATRCIRQREGFEGRHTPIVALTAHAMEGSREASLQSGMDDQITKPLTMAVLTGKLLEWLVPAGAPQP